MASVRRYGLGYACNDARRRSALGGFDQRRLAVVPDARARQGLIGRIAFGDVRRRPVVANAGPGEGTLGRVALGDIGWRRIVADRRARKRLVADDRPLCLDSGSDCRGPRVANMSAMSGRSGTLMISVPRDVLERA